MTFSASNQKEKMLSAALLGNDMAFMHTVHQAQMQQKSGYSSFLAGKPSLENPFDKLVCHVYQV